MQRILITGTNRGLGLELARQYAARGDTVFATCRRPDQADALHRLADTHPGRVTIAPLDVADVESVNGSAQIVREHTGALDVLVNNAAYHPQGGAQDFGTFDADELAAVLKTNVVGPMMVAQACFDLLRAGTNPRIANISSGMGSLARHDYGGDYGYSASKAALNMVTRMLAADLRRYKIVAVSIDPGWVRTDMGGRGATLTPEQSARGLLRVIDGLTARDSGGYLRWDGGTHPW